MNRVLLFGGALLVGVPYGVAAQGAPAAPTTSEPRTAYVTRCAPAVASTDASLSPQIVQSICESRYEAVLASGPMAVVILTIATPALGTGAGGAAAERLRLWSGTDRLPGDVSVTIDQGPPRTANLSWDKAGEPIPFDLREALVTLGKTVETVGCLSYGAGEGGRAYRVSSARHEPFSLIIRFREAALASQSSSFQALARYGGTPVALAELRRDGEEWTEACPA